MNPTVGKVFKKIFSFCSNVLASSQKALLFDALVGTSLSDKPCQRVKMGFIDGVMLGYLNTLKNIRKIPDSNSFFSLDLLKLNCKFSLCLSLYINTYLCVYMSVYIYLYMYVCVYIYKYIYAYIHMYIYMYNFSNATYQIGDMEKYKVLLTLLEKE